MVTSTVSVEAGGDVGRFTAEGAEDAEESDSRIIFREKQRVQNQKAQNKAHLL